MKLKALLLDLDGTLVDTAPDMVGALNRLLEQHNKPIADYHTAKQQVSRGAIALIKHGFKIDDQHPELANLRQQFLDEYEQHICLDSKVFDGMHEVLELCQTNNIRWGIVTNKPYYLAEPLLAQLDMLEHCSILLGGNSLAKAKPHPMPLLHCCMELSLAPSECLYVGDDERDIIAGKAAGMDTAAAAWGYFSQDINIDDWNADYRINSPQGLHRLIEERLSSR